LRHSPPIRSPLLRWVEQHFGFTDRTAVALMVAIAAEHKAAVAQASGADPTPASDPKPRTASMPSHPLPT
jgi:hypothetical protein